LKQPTLIESARARYPNPCPLPCLQKAFGLEAFEVREVEDRRFDAQHPFAPARGRRQIEKLSVEGRVALSPAAARRS